MLLSVFKKTLSLPDNCGGGGSDGLRVKTHCGGKVEGVTPLWGVVNVGEERGVAGHLLVRGQHGGVPGYLLHITSLNGCLNNKRD